MRMAADGMKGIWKEALWNNVSKSTRLFFGNWLKGI